MNQDLKTFHKGEKGVKQFSLSLTGIGKPLDQLPAKSVMVHAANEVELRGIAGKAGGLNIEKQQILSGANPV